MMSTEKLLLINQGEHSRQDAVQRSSDEVYLLQNGTFVSFHLLVMQINRIIKSVQDQEEYTKISV